LKLIANDSIKRVLLGGGGGGGGGGGVIIGSCVVVTPLTGLVVEKPTLESETRPLKACSTADAATGTPLSLGAALNSTSVLPAVMELTVICFFATPRSIETSSIKLASNVALSVVPASPATVATSPSSASVAVTVPVAGGVVPPAVTSMVVFESISGVPGDGGVVRIQVWCIPFEQHRV
jgi:hypothetical protein